CTSLFLTALRATPPELAPLHDALPSFQPQGHRLGVGRGRPGQGELERAFLGLGSGNLEYGAVVQQDAGAAGQTQESTLQVPLPRSEGHTSELQSLAYLVCRLLLEKTNQ